MTQGYVLYRDIFSHHFHFAYLWSFLNTLLFGTNIVAARISLLLLYTLTTFFAMQTTKQYIQLGIASLIWSAIGVFYFKHLVLYQTISGFSVCLFFVCLFNIKKSCLLSPKKFIFVGILGGMAVSANPIAVFPTMVGCLYFTVFLLTRNFDKKSFFQKLKPMLHFLIGIMLIPLICFLYLLINNSVEHFYSQVIHFNSAIYTKYSYNPTDIKVIWNTLISFFNLKNIFPLRAKLPELTLQNFHGSFFTATFFRLSALISFILLLVKRSFIKAAFVYLFFSLTLLRTIPFFTAQEYVQIALYLSVWTINGLILLGSREYHKRIITTFIQISLLILSTAITLNISFLTTRSLLFILQNQENLETITSQQVLEQEEKMRSIKEKCGSIEFLYYPVDDFYIYFNAQLEPASKYTFMTPWVADIALDDVKNALELKKAEKIYLVVLRQGHIWNYPNQDYMASLFTFLEEEYVEIEPSVWVSPGLNKCLAQTK
jgi:hypothetical protein